MGTGTILAALGVGLGVYLVSKKAGTGEVPIKGIGQSAKVTGKSGKSWTTVVAKIESGFTFVNVYANEMQFGPHKAFPVLQYRQAGNDASSRLLTIRFDRSVPAAFATAVEDFGIEARTG